MKNLRTVTQILFSLPMLASSLARAQPSATPAATLTLDAYVEQVRNGGKSYESLKLSSDGSLRRSGESEILMAPTLFLNTYATRDASPTQTPAFQGTLTNTQEVQLGVSKLFNFGLNAKLYYDVRSTSIQGTSFLPFPSYFFARPAVEFTQSLWRNWGGSEFEAQKKATEAQALSTHYQDSFRAKQLLGDTESTFWTLLFTRKTVKLQEELYQRAKKLSEWSGRRFSNNLSDRSDVLQSQAALQLRQLEMESAQSDERAAALAFNKARSVEGDEVREELIEPNIDRLIDYKVEDRVKFRDDVLASEQQMVLANTSHSLAMDRSKPTLEVYGMVGATGLQPGFADTLSQSFDPSKSIVTLGVRLNYPLISSTLEKAVSGRAAERISSEISFQKKVFDQEQDWTDLNRRMRELGTKLKLAISIEKAQLTKANFEKERLTRGRSTTSQVIIFENDYSQALLTRIRIQADLLRAYASLKLFKGTSL